MMRIHRPLSSRFALPFAAAVAASAALVAAPALQKPAEAAAAMSGRWNLNRALSPGLAPATAPGGGRRSGAPGFLSDSPALLVLPAQRRGGGGGDAGGGAGASGAGLSSFQAVPETILIKAAEDSVTFSDVRGDRTYAVTGKDVKMEIAGAEATVNSKWDKSTLKQKITTGETSMTFSWELAQNNTRLNYKLTTLDLANPTRIKEVKAVYDKQP